MQLFDVYSLFDLTPVRGRGAYVFDAEGRRYLDFYGGHAVISIGHAHPRFVERVGDQLARLAFYSNSVINPLQEELAEKLGKACGLEDYRLFLVSSGAEANENALKLASFHTGRQRVIAFRGGFHGRTSAAVNVTDNEAIKAPLNRGFPVTFLPMNDLDALATELKVGDVAAVIVEGIQGVGGVFVPDASFLLEVQKLCTAEGAVLILDEVQSGFGRSGRFFAFQHSEVRPDLITMAKGMGNGFPVGGVLIAPHFQARKGMLGTTFGGSHLACAAVISVLDVIEEEGLVTNAAEKGRYLKERLLGSGRFEEVRGHGLMIGLQLDRPAASVRRQLLFEHRVFTGSAKDPHTIRLLPPLTVTTDACDTLLSSLDKVMESAPAHS